MICPKCGNKMIDGKAQNITLHHMTLLFNKTGEKIKLKDYFKNDSINSIVPAGSETEAYYCENCKKMILITDCVQ